MKLLPVIAAGLTLVISVGAAPIQPELLSALATADEDQKFPVEFVMKAQADARELDATIEFLPKPQRRARVRATLEEFAARTQEDLVTTLRAKDEAMVDDIRSYWLVNMVSCWATKSVIYEIASREDIECVLYARIPVELVKPELKVPPPSRDQVEPNLITTNARGAWRQGYTGQGIVIGVVDTGVRYTHLDLRDHLWTSTAYPNCGFNFASEQYSSGHPGPSPYDTLTPLDYYGHGTHCAGIAAADGAYGNGVRDTMGVAPSAKIMSVPVDVYLHTPYPDTSMENNTIAGMQFCVSPTRDPTNGADVITMSLGLVSSWLPRRAVWRAAEVNIEAAGIVHCVAAGNEGPSERTIRTSGDCPPPWPNPANHPSDRATSAVITVGATDNNDVIASFSSRGPSDWGSVPPYNDYAYPPGLMDPDVCMPGVNILSTYYNGDQSYTTMSGTSMATPGAAGVVALMLSKNPNLSPRQIDSILEMHAVRDLGTPGKDLVFGAGRINCSLAVAFTPLPSGVRLYRRTFDDVAGGNGDSIVNPGEAINVPTWIINLDNNPHYGVVAWITKRDTSSLFTITDSLRVIGNIPANDSAYTGADGFKFTVAGNAANGNVLPMNLICKDATDSTWISPFDVAVGTPVLTYAGLIVYDSPPGGNSNGIIDPGETVTLVARVANTGGGHGYNVQGVLRAADSRFNITDSLGTYGTIRRDSTAANQADRYGLIADGGIPPGTSISCTLRLVADGGYSFARPFTVRVGLPATPGTVVADHDTGYCRLTVTCLGSVGYDTPNSPQQGNGFQYPKGSTTGLYYGSMMAGTAPAYVVDRFYGLPATNINTDWAIVESLRFYPALRGDEMTVAVCDDRAHPAARGLKVIQTGYMTAQPGYDDFVVLVYDYQNTGTQAINGLYSGVIADFDIGSATSNVAYTEPTRRTAYIYYTGNPTMGIKLLDPTTASNLTVIDHAVYVYPETALSEGSKFGFLNGALSYPQSNRSYDWSVCVAAGPFDLAPGQTQRVAYAIVGGTSTGNYLDNCDSAQSWYDQNLVAVGEGRHAMPRTVSLLTVIPNPFSRTTCISYTLPQAGNLRISVLDAAGRAVSTLFEGEAEAGTRTVLWRAANVPRGVYFVQAEADGQRTIRKVMLIR